MSHQDQDGRSVSCQASELRRALAWLVRPSALGSITFRQNCSWTPMSLVAAALVWAWSDEGTLGERFQTARKIVQHLHSPQQEPAGSYQAFLKMLVRWTADLVILLQVALRGRLVQSLAARWERFGFVIFGVDGSRLELPRTESHAAAYAGRKRPRKKRSQRPSRQSARARARKANTPQMWLTMVWHATTRLPWDWRIGPADSSEREHWRQMLPQLPPNALSAVDAGFVGYEYVREVIASGRHLLLRIGSNVSLLRQLGHAREREGLVYLWPKRALAKQQPPIRLRLVVTHNGRHPVHLVTSVLDEQRLSDLQLLEIYRERWGIEVFYRHLKQTFARRKLKSTSAPHARVELEWSLIGLWAMALYAEVQLARDEIPATRMSFALVIRAFRRVLRDYLHPVERGDGLCPRLRRAIIDDYRRGDKSSRNYPRKKQEKPPGSPKITLATPLQRQVAKQHLKRLTA